MARIAVLCPDLMLASKVNETLSSAGHEVALAAAPEQVEASEPPPELVVADLGELDPKRLARLGPPVLGFYSHVDVDTRRRGEAEGIELVVPRSRLAREMPALVDSLLAP